MHTHIPVMHTSYTHIHTHIHIHIRAEDPLPLSSFNMHLLRMLGSATGHRSGKGDDGVRKIAKSGRVWITQTKVDFTFLHSGSLIYERYFGHAPRFRSQCWRRRKHRAYLAVKTCVRNRDRVTSNQERWNSWVHQLLQWSLVPAVFAASNHKQYGRTRIGATAS
jgi:hypothetical protein